MMDISWLTEWLKTTVPGIILLGALGSVVAVISIRLVGPLLKRVILKPLRYVTKERMWRFWRSSAAYAHIEKDPTNRKLIYYLFYHLARLLIALTCLLASILVLAIVVASQVEIFLTYGTFILSTFTFLSAYWVWGEYENITINFVIEWRKTGLVKDPFPDTETLTGTEKAEAVQKRGNN